MVIATKVAGLLNGNCGSAKKGNPLTKKVEEVYQKLPNAKLITTYDENSMVGAIDELSKWHPDLWCLISGDGGLLSQMSYYFNKFGTSKPLSLWYIPFGTNDREGRNQGSISSLAFGDRRDEQRERHLNDIAEEIIKGNNLKMRKMNVMKTTLTTPNDEKKTYYSFDFCAGLPAEAVMSFMGLTEKEVMNNDFQNSTLDYDPFAILRTILGSIAKSLSGPKAFKGSYAKVRVDGELIRGNDFSYYMALYASTSETALLFMRPMWRSREGQMHLMATWMPTSRAPKYIPRWVFGYNFEGADPHSVDIGVKHLGIEFREPTVIQMAGELSIVTYAEMEIIPDLAEFVKPKFGVTNLYPETIAYHALKSFAYSNLVVPFEKMYPEVLLGVNNGNGNHRT